MSPDDAAPAPFGRRTFLAAAALAVGALATACGDDGGSTGAATTTTGAPATSAPPTPAPSTAPPAAQFVVSGPKDHDRVALTFHTNGDLGLVDQLLDVFASKKVHVTAFIVGDWLEAAGYAVRKAPDGPAGLAEVERTAPALVVTDMCMPGAAGSAIIQSLKQDHPEISVIAISGYFSRSGCTADDAVSLGAARALAKPLKRGEMMRVVAELIGPPGH